MRSSDQPRQAGYILSVALIAIILSGFALATFWFQSRQVETDLLYQQLSARLEHELPREVQYLYAQARASGEVLDRQRIEAQAFINLHARGRRQMVELEKKRQHVKQLVINRVDARRQLRQLGLEVRRAKMWVMLLERKLKTMPQVRREPHSIFRLPPFGGTFRLPPFGGTYRPPSGETWMMPSWTVASTARATAEIA